MEMVSAALAQELLDKLLEASAINNILLSALKEAEWSARTVNKTSGLVDYCPCCRKGNDKGHSPQCNLNNAIKLAEIYKYNLKRNEGRDQYEKAK